MDLKLCMVAVAAALATGDAAVASSGAPLVFPLPAGACHRYPCAIDGYGNARGVADSIVIPAGAAASGLVQSQIVDASSTTADVLYSAYNGDKSVLQTLWVHVMPSRGGYHVMLTT